MGNTSSSYSSAFISRDGHVLEFDVVSHPIACTLGMFSGKLHACAVASTPVGIPQEELLTLPSSDVAKLVHSLAASDLSQAFLLSVEPPVDVGLAIIS